MTISDAESNVQIEHEGNVSRVWINRPEVRNAFDADTIRQLHEAFDRLSARKETKAIVIQGRGRVFCAGADLNWMKASKDLTPEENTADSRKMAKMFQSIRDCPKFVIAAVNGHSLGGGMGILGAADAVLSVKHAKFGFTEARLGIVPAVISSFCLPKIGPSWARRLFASAEIFKTDRAVQIGLVHDVYEDQPGLDAGVAALITELRYAGPEAMAIAKSIPERVASCANLDDAVEECVNLISTVRKTPEAQEGFNAFLEKRPSAWST